MTIIGILLIAFFGYQLTDIFTKKTKSFEKIALGYILGIGIFTFCWFLTNLFGVPYSKVGALILILLLILITSLINKLVSGSFIRKINFELNYFKKLNSLQKTTSWLIVFLLLSAIVANLYWPVRYWDSLVMYDFRAKLFAETGFMNTAISQGYFSAYPLLTSLAHTLVYVTGFGNPSFIYGLFYISMVTLFFENFRKFNLNKTFTLLLTLLAAVSPRIFDHTQWAYTNLPYTIYIVFGSIYLYWGIKSKDIGSYLLSAVLIGLSTWTRSTEPFWLTYFGLAFIAAFFIKKWLWPFVYSTTFVSLMMPWRIFQANIDKSSANVAKQVIETSNFATQNLQINVIKPAIDFFVTNVVKMYLIYFILLTIIVLFKVVTKSKKWFFVAIIICNLILALVGTIVFSRSQTGWQDIPDSLSRMVMFMPPLIIFLLGEEIDRITSNINE